jgi:hypothetical protein
MSEEQLMLCVVDSPAKTSASPENDVALMASAVVSGLSSNELSTLLSQRGWSSKMFRAYSLATVEPTLPSSFNGWLSAGMAWGGECLTVKASDLPSDGSVCLLSEVLEHQVDARYYLSPKACAGILRRAERRGKVLTDRLRIALQHIMHEDQTTTREH